MFSPFPPMPLTKYHLAAFLSMFFWGTRVLWAGESLEPEFARQMHQDILFSDAWIEIVSPDTPNTVAYVTLTNQGNEPRRVVEVSTFFAHRTELHEVKIDLDNTGNYHMMVESLQDGLLLPPGETRRLNINGIHIRLIYITEHLLANEVAPIYFTFDDGSTAEILFTSQDTREE